MLSGLGGQADAAAAPEQIERDPTGVDGVDQFVDAAGEHPAEVQPGG